MLKKKVLFMYIFQKQLQKFMRAFSLNSIFFRQESISTFPSALTKRIKGFEHICEVKLTLIDLEPKPGPGFVCACLSGCLRWPGGPSA